MKIVHIATMHGQADWFDYYKAYVCISTPTTTSRPYMWLVCARVIYFHNHWTYPFGRSRHLNSFPFIQLKHHYPMISITAYRDIRQYL
jgi:hypothetical protein